MTMMRANSTTNTTEVLSASTKDPADSSKVNLATNAQCTTTATTGGSTASTMSTSVSLSSLSSSLSSSSFGAARTETADDARRPPAPPPPTLTPAAMMVVDTTTTLDIQDFSMKHNDDYNNNNKEKNDDILSQSSNSKEEEETHENYNDTNKRIHLPVLKYGYRTEPLTWDELIDILLVTQDLARLSRSVDQQVQYQIYQRNLLQTWHSVVDHILCTKFGRRPVVIPKMATNNDDNNNDKPEKDLNDGGRYQASPPLEPGNGGRVETVVVRNDFPYYLDQDIEHYVLWKLGGLCTEADIDDAKRQLREQLGDVVDFLHWVNPPHLKSIPDIDHVHILVRRQGNAGNNRPES